MAKSSWLDRAKSGAALGLHAAFLPSKAVGSINDTLYGTHPKTENISNFDPFQQGIHEQQGNALQGGGGYGSLIEQLRGMLDPNSEYHQAFENQQIGQFNEKTVPQLAERFAGQGANSGALSSSGFGQSLGAAGAGLQRDLAVNKTNTIQDALQKLLTQYSQYQNQTTFDRKETPGTEGMIQKFLPVFLKALQGG